MYRLTSEERVLLHLNGHGDLSEDSYIFPMEVSQKGISDTVGVARKHLPRVMKRLVGEGLVKECKGRITGAKQKLKVYLLTSKGFEESKRIEKFISDAEVSIVSPDGKKSCKLSEISKQLGIDRPVAYWALRLKEDGSIDSGHPLGSDTKSESMLAYKRALTSVMSDGEVTPIEEEMLSHLRGLLGISDEDAERAYSELLTRDDIEPPIRLDVYEDVLRQIVEDNIITEDERMVMDLLKKKLGISDELHDKVMRRVLENVELTAVKERQSIEDVFMIYHDGRLIAHLSRRIEVKIAPDSDLVAGMFTAIQSFMDDLFKGITIGDIEELRYAGYYFIVETGKFVSLAVSSKSRLSEHTRNKIKGCLNRIECDFKDELLRWDGSISAMAPVSKALSNDFEIKMSK